MLYIGNLVRKQAIIEKLAYISPISRLYLPISPLYLPCISPGDHREAHLAYISPVSPCTSPVSPQAIIEKLISHRFFRRKQGLPRMAKHMEQQRHRARQPEPEPKP